MDTMSIAIEVVIAVWKRNRERKLLPGNSCREEAKIHFNLFLSIEATSEVLCKRARQTKRQ